MGPWLQQSFTHSPCGDGDHGDLEDGGEDEDEDDDHGDE